MSGWKVFQEITDKLIKMPQISLGKENRFAKIAGFLRGTAIMLWIPEDE